MRSGVAVRPALRPALPAVVWVRLVPLLLAACSDPAPALPGHLAPCPSTPNCVSSEALPSDTTHYIEPLRPPNGVGFPNNALVRLRNIGVGMPRTELAGGGRTSLRLTVSSRVFGFKDDLELRVDTAHSLVDVRSASRFGWGDGGVNRERVEDLRASWTRTFDAPDDGTVPAPSARAVPVTE
ncbi:MAG: DUF1499 domain-containing protein [Myxococcales bacterium]|nr:DUF1499 domain-containing protein [Myxococcales bacterium]